MQLDLLWRNPIEVVEAPQPESKEVEPMKLEILERALSVVAASDLLMPTLLAVGAGMRRGEVLGLRWRDLDFETGTVRLSQTVQTDPEHGWVFTGTKTHRSRVFHLPPFVLKALRAHRKAQNHRRLLCGGGWVDHDLVIDRGDGSPMRPVAAVPLRSRESISASMIFGMRTRLSR